MIEVVPATPREWARILLAAVRARLPRERRLRDRIAQTRLRAALLRADIDELVEASA